MNGTKTASRPGLLLLIIIAAIVGGLCMPASAGDVAQINLILDDGVVLIYKGADYGMHTGDYLDVLRDGQTIGSLIVTDVFPTFTKAKIASQDKSIQVFDVVTIGAPGKAPVEKKEEKKAPAKKEETKKEEKKTESKKVEPKKEEKKAETKKEETKKETPKKEEKKAETKKDDKKKEEKAPVAQKNASRTYTQIDLGYFYLNQDFGSSSINQPPVITYGIDYWGPAKKGHRMMYSGAYARPKIRISTSGSPITISAKLYYLSANYIIDRPGKEQGSTGNFYYGGGLAYRKFAMDLGSAGLAGIGADESSQTGIDFHGIVGYRFNSNLDFKGLYSFDEDYYSLTVGYSTN